jgi:hypothetical protein
LVVLVIPLLAGEKMAMGGLVLNKLKKLKGLRFGFPFLSIVLTNATGRGATTCDKYPIKAGNGSSLGFSVSMKFFVSRKNKKKASHYTMLIKALDQTCSDQIFISSSFLLKK